MYRNSSWTGRAARRLSDINPYATAEFRPSGYPAAWWWCVAIVAAAGAVVICLTN